MPWWAIAWIVYSLYVTIWPFLKEVFGTPTVVPTSPKIKINRPVITQTPSTHDMILHDLTNNNDKFDIGVIDFNE